ALEDAIDITSRAAVQVGDVGAVAGKPAARSEGTIGIGCRKAMPIGERNDPVAMDDHADIRRQDKAAGALTLKLADPALDLGGIGKRNHYRSYAERRRSGFQRTLQTGAGNVVATDNERDARHAGRNLLEQLHELARYGVFEKRKAGDVGAGVRHVGDDAFGNRVD